jgi:hypothetical protein
VEIRWESLPFKLQPHGMCYAKNCLTNEYFHVSSYLPTDWASNAFSPLARS